MKKNVVEVKSTKSIELPSTPNFVKVDGVMRPISELTPFTIRKIGREWTKELLAKADKKKTNA